MRQQIDKNDDRYPKCLICNNRFKMLGIHLNRAHNSSREEYAEKFGIDVNDKHAFTCQETSKKLSDNLAGDRNPWFNHGGAMSPFSMKNKRSTKESISEVATRAMKSSISNNNSKLRIEYYTSRGHSQEEAKILLKERQSTFSLEKCIKKYGEEIGRQRWIDRQEKWHKSYKKTNYSKISQELFWMIKDKISDECIFATYLKNNKNEEFVFRTKMGSAYKLDFYILSKKKIIEFDGDYWHSDRSKNKIANKSREEERDNYILETDSELSILHVKECNFRENKEKVVQECLDFINN